MEELKMLNEVIKDRLEKANDLEPGTKEREVFDHGTAEFIQRRNDLLKTLSDSDSAAEQHELETAKLEEEKKNRWIQFGLTVGTAVVYVAHSIYTQCSDHIFNETGTVTSIGAKAVLQDAMKPFTRIFKKR